MKFARCITLVFSLQLLAVVARASAQNDSATQPTTIASGDFEVHEWVIFVCDPFQPKANSDAMFMTTLPEFLNSRRKQAPTTQSSEPYPVGVIRFVGASNVKIDVKLNITSGGKLMAAWPKPRSRSGNVLWRDLVISREPGQLKAIEEADSWLNVLRRDAASAYLTADSVSERFLLYDAEHEYALPLKLAGGRNADDPLQVANTGTVSLHDVAFYRPDPKAGAGAWRSGFIAELSPGKKVTPSTAPTSSPTTAPSTSPAQVSDVESLGVEPADVKQVRLAATATTRPSDFLSDWKDRLAREGVTSADRDTIIRILAKHALDPARLTVVYRLDPAELDRIVPIEVIPTPRKLTRVGLVIVRNIDPAVPAEIDDLIVQLGDGDWKVREAASKSLASLGQAAKAKLQSATKNADPEIGLRAERLLASMEK